MTVVVVGASGGIGQAIARRFATAGHDVLGTFLRAERSAANLVDDLTRGGFSARMVQLDVRNPAAIADVLAEAGDDLEGVVLASGSGVATTISSFRDRHWDWVFDTNPRAFARVVRLSIPLLADRGGFITSLTSGGSQFVLPSYSLIGPAKAALESAVRYAACEAGPVGVRVNAVSPGLVVTKALSQFPDIERHIHETTRQTPLGHLVAPDDVAELVYWLATPAAQMITGQTIVIDGGWALRGGVE